MYRTSNPEARRARAGIPAAASAGQALPAWPRRRRAAAVGKPASGQSVALGPPPGTRPSARSRAPRRPWQAPRRTRPPSRLPPPSRPRPS